jgi:PBSX family phage terminase large subunit
LNSKQIVFEPFPKQIEFLEAIFSNKYNFIMYGGAIRGGKTFAGIGALLLLCKMYPNSKWCIVRDTLQTLKRTTIPSFNKVCPQSFIKSYNQDTQTVHLTNGSQIIFMGENFADDKELNRFKGLEVNGFLLEEINELQQKTFYKCIERAGSQIIDKQPKPIILATCNPSNNWVKELIYNKWKLNDLPDNWLYIPSKITDNPFVPESYLESLKTLTTYEYQVFVEGNWELQERTGSEFYKCFNLDKHVKRIEYNPELPLHISWDENVNPYLPCGIFQIQGTEIRMIDEILGINPRNTVHDVCNEFKYRYHDHNAGLFIYGDATSQKEDVKQQKGYNFFRLIENELMQYQPTLRVARSNPSVVMRANFINKILDKNLYDLNLLISDNCKTAISDFTNTKEASDGTKDKAKERDSKTGISYQKYGHLSDLTDYLICEAFSDEYSRFQHGDIIVGRSIGRNYISDKHKM